MTLLSNLRRKRSPGNAPIETSDRSMPVSKDSPMFAAESNLEPLQKRSRFNFYTDYRERRQREKLERMRYDSKLREELAQEAEMDVMLAEEKLSWEAYELQIRNLQRLIRQHRLNKLERKKRRLKQMEEELIAKEEGFTFHNGVLKEFLRWRDSPALYQSYVGHSGQVYAFKVSDCNDCILSASADTTLKLWNFKSGACVRTFEGHAKCVRDCDLSPDFSIHAQSGLGLAVSCSADKSIRLWNARQGTLRRELRAHTHVVYACRFSPDGQSVCSASADCTLRLWHSLEGYLLFVFYGHQSPVVSVAFSQSGRYLVSSSDFGERAIKVWTTDVPATSTVAHMALRVQWTTTGLIRRMTLMSDAPKQLLQDPRMMGHSPQGWVRKRDPWILLFSDSEDEETPGESAERAASIESCRRQTDNEDDKYSICRMDLNAIDIADVNEAAGFSLSVASTDRFARQTRAESYNDGKTLHVSLRGVEQICNFFISCYLKSRLHDAFSATSGRRCGRFDKKTPFGTRLTCDGAAVASTKRFKPCNEVNLSWIAPGQGTGTIVLRATVMTLATTSAHLDAKSAYVLSHSLREMKKPAASSRFTNPHDHFCNENDLSSELERFEFKASVLHQTFTEFIRNQNFDEAANMLVQTARFKLQTGAGKPPLEATVFRGRDAVMEQVKRYMANGVSMVKDAKDIEPGKSMTVVLHGTPAEVPCSDEEDDRSSDEITHVDDENEKLVKRAAARELQRIERLKRQQFSCAEEIRTMPCEPCANTPLPALPAPSSAMMVSGMFGGTDPHLQMALPAAYPQQATVIDVTRRRVNTSSALAHSKKTARMGTSLVANMKFAMSSLERKKWQEQVKRLTNWTDVAKAERRLEARSRRGTCLLLPGFEKDDFSSYDDLHTESASATISLQLGQLQLKTDSQKSAQCILSSRTASVGFFSPMKMLSFEQTVPGAAAETTTRPDCAQDLRQRSPGRNFSKAIPSSACASMSIRRCSRPEDLRELVQGLQRTFCSPRASQGSIRGSEISKISLQPLQNASKSHASGSCATIGESSSSIPWCSTVENGHQQSDIKESRHPIDASTRPQRRCSFVTLPGLARRSRRAEIERNMEERIRLRSRISSGCLQTFWALTPRNCAAHHHAVNQVTWSADETRVASCSSDKTVRLWSPQTGQLVRTLTGHEDAVMGVSFSEDVLRLVSCGLDNVILLWNLVDGSIVRRFRGHDDSVYRCVLFRNASIMMSCSSDTTLKSWFLTPQKPDAPPRCDVIEAGRTAMIVTWRSPPSYNEEITAFKIQYKSGLREGFGNEQSVDGSTFKKEIKNLLPGNYYAFRICAVNRMGQGDWSAPSTLRSTEVGLPPEPAQPIVLRALSTPTSVALCWYAPQPTAPGTALSEFQLQAAGAGFGFGERSDLSRLVSWRDGALLARNHFEAELAAQTAKEADVSKGTEPSSRECPAETTNKMDGTVATRKHYTTHSAVVARRHLNKGKALVEAEGVTCARERISAFGRCVVIAYRFDRLDPGFEWRFRVSATSAVGCGKFSQPTYTVTTPPAPPDRPLAPTGCAESKTTITVFWLTPKENGSAVMRFELEPQRDADRDDNPPSRFFARKKCSTKVDGLEPGESQCFRVRAYNAAGASAWSDWSDPIATKTGLPDTPQRPTCVKAAIISLELEIAKPNDSGRPLSSIHIERRELQAGGVKSDWRSAVILPPPPGPPGATSRVRIEDLRADTVYQFRCAASNSHGVSTWSLPSLRARTLLPQPPEKPAHPRARACFSNFCDLVWTPADPNGSSLTGHIIQLNRLRSSLAKSSSKLPAISSDIILDGTLSSVETNYIPQYRAEDLESPPVSYVFRVAARNAVGESPFSDWSLPFSCASQDATFSSSKALR